MSCRRPPVRRGEWREPGTARVRARAESAGQGHRARGEGTERGARVSGPGSGGRRAAGPCDAGPPRSRARRPIGRALHGCFTDRRAQHRRLTGRLRARPGSSRCFPPLVGPRSPDEHRLRPRFGRVHAVEPAKRLFGTISLAPVFGPRASGERLARGVIHRWRQRDDDPRTTRRADQRQ